MDLLVGLFVFLSIEILCDPIFGQHLKFYQLRDQSVTDSQANLNKMFDWFINNVGLYLKCWLVFKMLICWFVFKMFDLFINNVGLYLKEYEQFPSDLEKIEVGNSEFTALILHFHVLTFFCFLVQITKLSPFHILS